MRVLTIPMFVAALLAAGAWTGVEQKPTGPYWVTSTPLDLGIGHEGFCIAVQPNVADGVWWWSPGRTGCASRSTGPDVFHPERARVSTGANGNTDIRFQIQQIVAPSSPGPKYVDVVLVLGGGYLSIPSSGKRVAVEQRDKLKVPEGS